jgi:small subunit ribosomal protein S4
MSRSTEPRMRVMRALGAQLPGLSRKSIDRRPYPPGQHGQGRKKVTDFGIRLREKQKLRKNYGVTERQLRNLVAEAARGRTGTDLKLIELLERRLDNAVFRAGFARTIPAARQLVTHGHVRINERRVDIPSYRVRTGEVISLIEGALANAHVQAALADATRTPPSWIERAGTPPRALVRDLPDETSVMFNIETQLVVEFYSLRL